MGEDGKAVDFKPPGFLGLSQCIIEKALFCFFDIKIMPN